MNIHTNTKLIERNIKIAKATFYISLIILGAGMYLSFKYPNDVQMLTWMMVSLIVGLILSQISVYYQNKFGKSPRPDEQITTSLKGIGGKYSLFHYCTPVSHLLIGPTGLWVIIPYSINGKVTYEKNKWKQKGGSFFMKIFGGESIGRPDLEAEAAQKDIQKALSAEFPEEEVPAIQVILLFLHPKIIIEVGDTPLPTLPADKLKDYLRKQKKSVLLSPEAVEKYTDFFVKKFEEKSK